MRHVGAGIRRAGIGRTQRGTRRRWQGAAVVLTAVALVACASGGPVGPSRMGSAARYERAVRAGLDLYDAAEYELAALRFEDAAVEGAGLRDRDAEKRAVIAECTAWLRGRRLPELAECTERLEVLHRRSDHAEPGLGALLALGAIAGGRPLPSFRIDPAVQPLIRASHEEEL